MPKWLLVAFAAVALAYAMQAFTPLRLMNDSVIYLGMAESHLAGHGFLFAGEESRLPAGYAAILAAFLVLGLDLVPSVVLWNALFLFVGVAAIQLACRRVYGLSRDQGLILALVTLVSYHFVKHLAVPMSDSTFFGVASVCLLCLVTAEQSSGRARWGWLAAALPMVALSVILRTVGVALLVSALWVVLKSPFLWSRVAPQGHLSRTAWIWLGVGSVVALAGGFLAAREMMYWAIVTERYELAGGLVQGVALLVKLRLIEVGMVAANLPRAPRVASMLVNKAWMLTVMLTAIPAIAVVARAVWGRRARLSVLEVYTLATLGLLWVMPWNSERHTMQVVPILFALGWIGVRDLAGIEIAGRFARAYVVWVLVSGTAGLAMSSWITFSGSDFPERYPYNAHSNRIAYGTLVDDGQAHPELVRLMRKYEPHLANRE